jgi:hypothetical protein
MNAGEREAFPPETPSPQSKSRARSTAQKPESSIDVACDAAFSAVTSSPGQGSTDSVECATKAGSTPSIVSSKRACSSVLNSGWFPNGSSLR